MQMLLQPTYWNAFRPIQFAQIGHVILIVKMRRS